MFLFSAIKRRWNEPLGYREILRVGLPLIMSMMSLTLMQLVDRFFLSHHSMNSIAAVVPASYAHMTPYFLVMGTVSYTTVIVAQYVGSQAPHRVGPAVWQGIWGAIVGGIFIATLWFVAEPIFKAAGHPPRGH